jgi:hypothetical protein
MPVRPPLITRVVAAATPVYVQQPPNLLISTFWDSFFPDRNPQPPSVVLENPRGPSHRYDGWQWNSLQNAEQAPAVVYFRPPTITRIHVRDRSVAVGSQVTQPTTHAIPFGIPLRPVVLENPRRARTVPPTWTLGQQQGTLGLPVPAGIPRQPLIIRIPRREHAVSLRTWVSPLKLNLLGQDEVLGSPGEAPAFDWPTPEGPSPRDLGTWTANLATGPLSVTTGNPVRPVVLENPRRAKTVPPTWVVDLVRGTLSINPGVPVRPVVIENPRRPRSVAQTWALDILKTTLGKGEKPFAQNEWRNPYGRVPSIALLSWTAVIPGTHRKWVLHASDRSRLKLTTGNRSKTNLKLDNQ